MELVMGVEVFINLFILALSVFLLSTGTTVLQLIAVLIVTQAVSALTCLIILQRARVLAPAQDPVEASVSELWLRTRPFFTLSIAEVLQQRIDILLLSIVAGPAVTGIYSAAYNLVRILVKLIQSFWQALYPTLSRLHHDVDSRYRTLSRFSLQAGLLILLPVAAIASGVSDELIRLVYTDEYMLAGPVLRLLIWTTPLVFASTYAVTQLMVHRQTTRSIVIIAASLVAAAIVLPPLAARSGAIGAGWASLLAAATGTTTGLYLVRHNDVPFELQHLRWLAVATLAAGLLAGLLPFFWLIRALVAAVAYIAVLMIGGTLNLSSARARYRVLRPDDR
jgi:O-antigen/teichoic acid export membrane protein